MALKPLAHKPPAPLPTAPSWGVVASEGEPLSVLRFECPDRTESLPYHTLTRWTHRLETEETVTIYAGSQVVIVRGRELRLVTEALDAGKLAVLCATETRYLHLKTGTAIVSIEFTPDAP